MKPEYVLTEWGAEGGNRTVRMEQAIASTELILIDVSRHWEPEALYEALQILCREELTRALFEQFVGLSSGLGFPQLRESEQDRSARATRAMRAQCRPERANSGERLDAIDVDYIDIVAFGRFVLMRWSVGPPIGTDGQRPSVDVAALLERVQHRLEEASERWNRDQSEITVPSFAGGSALTAGDLATILLYGATVSYTNVRRWLHEWLDGWETRFLDLPAGHDPNPEKNELLRMRRILMEFARPVRSLKVASEREADSWFLDRAHPDRARKVDEKLSRTLKDLRRISNRVHAALDLVQLQISRNSTHKLELVAAILIVPGLVATIYGANTDLPGREHWNGLAVMLAAMILSGAATYLFLNWHRYGSGRSTGSLTR